MPKKIDREIMKTGASYADVANSKYGLYGYFNEQGECLYVGIDSNIDKALRHHEHTSPSKRGEQAINKYVQSDAMKGLTYHVLHLCRDKEELENVEAMYILFFKALGQCKLNMAVSVNEEMTKKIIEGLVSMYRN